MSKQIIYAKNGGRNAGGSGGGGGTDDHAQLTNRDANNQQYL